MRNIQRDISGRKTSGIVAFAGFYVTTLTIANPLAHLLGHWCCYQTTIIRLYAYTRNDTLGISISEVVSCHSRVRIRVSWCLRFRHTFPTEAEVGCSLVGKTPEYGPSWFVISPQSRISLGWEGRQAAGVQSTWGTCGPVRTCAPAHHVDFGN